MAKFSIGSNSDKWTGKWDNYAARSCADDSNEMGIIGPYNI